MSRLIVKNLPKKISEAKIREIFGSKGNITDVQLKYTADGKFRQFAFIGYHDEGAADEAVELFHNTHIKTNKIAVEKCNFLGDTVQKKKKELGAAEEDNKLKKKKSKKKKSKSNELELLEKYKDDPDFEQFLQVHGKDAQKLLSVKRTEKSAEQDINKHSEGSDEDETAEKLANKNISDSEYMKSLMKGKGSEIDESGREKEPKKFELFTLKLRNLPYNCKKKAIKEFFRPLVPYSIRIPRNIKGIAYIGFKSDSAFKKALLKDRSFIEGKRISVAKYAKQEDKKEDVADPKRARWKTQEETLQHEEDIAESGRIFIRNLAYTTTEDDIQELFNKFGPITEVNLPVDFTTRKLKGFGVVTFLMPEHAVKAYTKLDGSILHGRMLHLLPGKAKDAPENEQEGANYKQKKAQKEKSQAGSSHNWNSLFLGHDAVADVIANTYGTTKQALLDPHGDGSAAVRLALGETKIVDETRKYLEKEGVILDTFKTAATKRSKTVILVKNLPADTTMREVRDMFEKFGVISRIIFPPSGITAIVEFMEASEARKAFMKLAYTKFKHTPLYLEWAPENSLVPIDKNNIGKIRGETADKSGSEAAAVDQKEEKKELAEEEEEEEDPEPDTTLYVKNLNFQTTDEAFRKHFESCGKLQYATVAVKKNKEDPSKRLSLGYGFVRFYHQSSVNKALKTLQCSTLDGKTLELKRSERTLPNDIKVNKKTAKTAKQTGTKILVRNVPFQANQKEIMELFRVFGEVKALRLPRKMGGESSHRGFAFVDYVTNSDAKKAFEALCQSTHLYGRRLVLEWATTEENVEQLRKRTAEHFHEEKPIKSKKSVLDIERL